ncbi:MAG: agmatine deiminase family protein [Candidatus Aminicenantes bacterium]|nr:MAG: agmatine deiminase family protein [Candidatus Aminicenantes bacterium]
MSLRRFLFICVLILSLVSLTIQLPGKQARKLTHEMTEEERALMPAYLESLKGRAQTPPPPAPVRNIAEFEQMEGVLIAYPLGIPVSLVADMSQDVMVTTIVDDAAEENEVRNLYSSAGVNMSNTNFLHAPHDSFWTRDYGPWFVTDGNGTISIINFTYNRPRPRDNNIPVEMANFLGLDLYEMDLVHAGGNYMTDGWGISVSTDLVWEENSSKTPAEINQIMNDYLGIHTYHVTDDPLGEYIKHVDCWGKYLDVDKILIGRVPQNDPQYSEYEAVVNYFANQTSGYGNDYQVYRVDTPNGQPYTNSLILNKRVFVPVVGSSYDSDAILDYETAMPGYEVIGVSGNWSTTDALHCRVIGIADRGLLYIKHMPLLGEQPEQSSYDITAEIIPYSGMPVIGDSVKIYYQVDGGQYYTVNMTNTSGDTYTGSIPGQPQGSEIAYYLHASDTSGRTSEHPFIGEPDPHVFTVSSPLLPPDADFTADKTTIFEGESIQFTDQSTNNPTSWSWSFPGGTPSGSLDQNPIVTYYEEGTYTVTLTAYNAAGSDTETKVDYITVLSAGSCLGEITNPGFETGSTSGWTETGSVSITSTAHTGSYGVSLDGGGSKIEQVVTGLCPNTTYTVSAWGIAKANAGVYLGVKDYGGSEQTVQFTDGRRWKQNSITFTTGAANTSVTIFFSRTSSKFGGIGDDFDLVIVN